MRLIASERFEEHVTPPGHPERMERARIFTAVAARWSKAGAVSVEPRPASREELARVHDEAYLDEIAATAGRAVRLDDDTYTSPESVEIAALAAGAAVQAAEHETGTGAGKGYTVNVPLEAGATDADYLLAYTAIVLPVLEEYQPVLTLISAGFDAHERDPLASMRMSTEGFGAIVGGLASLARRHGSLALVTEGGYDLTALEESLDASLTAIQGTGTELTASQSAAAPRGQRAVAAVRAAQHGLWRL